MINGPVQFCARSQSDRLNAKAILRHKGGRRPHLPVAADWESGHGGSERSQPGGERGTGDCH